MYLSCVWDWEFEKFKPIYDHTTKVNVVTPLFVLKNIHTNACLCCCVIRRIFSVRRRLSTAVKVQRFSNFGIDISFRSEKCIWKCGGHFDNDLEWPWGECSEHCLHFLWSHISSRLPTVYKVAHYLSVVRGGGALMNCLHYFRVFSQANLLILGFKSAVKFINFRFLMYSSKWSLVTDFWV